ncbi:hypothetical protein [Corynebacterium coyleae]|uniref:hypothetical protein n=1 Tax=Corynebacterium coyleae TaxID=53374 RepID=UPI0015E0B9B7|nr:hypothetical protein [Corynebacterium coyleae]
MTRLLKGRDVSPLSQFARHKRLTIIENLRKYLLAIGSFDNHLGSVIPKQARHRSGNCTLILGNLEVCCPRSFTVVIYENLNNSIGFHTVVRRFADKNVINALCESIGFELLTIPQFLGIDLSPVDLANYDRCFIIADQAGN